MSVLPRQAALEAVSHGATADVSQRSHAVPEVFPAGYFRWQPLLGWGLALIVAPLILPVVGLLVLLVRMTSRGPGIYRQLRVGKEGRTFWIYKIRTMRADAERETGPVWTSEDDPRITPVGRILRRFHLDELPQILNVLKGEMTLIGPRPERPEFCQTLAVAIPGYLQRYRVLPGITGLAQINLPPDTDLDSVRRKLVLDLEYIEKGNLWLDLRILLCTGLKMLGFPGLKIAALLRLTRTVRIPDWMRSSAPVDQLPLTFEQAIKHCVHRRCNGQRFHFEQSSLRIKKPR